ncbi:MAG: class I SAM-dependent methyltransferase [Rhizobiales bacterium]|nr:class I SAM-dependent methyltransferase [Hyphomicrobiales bacterium]
MTALVDNNPLFWDKIARKYAKQPIKDMKNYEATLARTKSYLKPDFTVLEVGAGTGSTALLLAPLVSHITVTDISSQMIEIGREKAKEQNIDNASFMVAEAFEATSKVKYDVVMAFNLLHLLEDIPAAVQKAASLTKKGGYFISKSGAVGEMNFAIKFMIKVMQKIGKAPYVSKVTHKELLGAFDNSGFEIIETDVYPKGGINRYIVAKKL